MFCIRVYAFLKLFQLLSYCCELAKTTLRLLFRASASKFHLQQMLTTLNNYTVMLGPTTDQARTELLRNGERLTDNDPIWSKLTI